MKEGEVIRQRTYVKEAWTWTMVKELIMEVEGHRLNGGGKGGKVGQLLQNK